MGCSRESLFALIQYYVGDGDLNPDEYWKYEGS
jgi:hypothetical protein